MGLFDVHAHLTDRRLAAMEDDVLARAASAGVTTIISNGLNPSDNARVAELAARAPRVKPAFGLYPVDAVLPEMVAMGVDYHREDEPLVAAEDAVAWVADHVDQCVAVGEIGLDGYWVPEALWARQEAIFRQLVTVAMDADKPIIIHTRKRERRALEILVEMGATRVDWHCFGSKVKLGLRIAEHPGQYLSIPANARKAESFRKLLEKLPRDRVLLETDCPYLGPVKGELNEPANVAGTAELAAELWGCTLADVQAQLEENFERLFGFAP
jgi:TatD DNase family protein